MEFIDTLKQQCRRYIAERGAATADQIQEFIENSVSLSPCAAPTSSTPSFKSGTNMRLRKSVGCLYY